MVDKIRQYLNKRREFRKKKQRYFLEKQAEIDAENLHMLYFSSAATTVLVFLFSLLTPFIIDGWRISALYYAFFLTSALLWGIIALTKKKRGACHVYINFFCWVYLTITMLFMMAVDVFPNPDLAASFTNVFLAVVPVMFIMQEDQICAFLLLMEVIYIMLISIYKTPVVGQNDIFNSIVGVMFGICLYGMVTKGRIEDNIQRFRFQELSQIDGMTGILNRAACERTIRHYLYSRDKETDCAMFVLDIDNFKRVNDTLGHQKGDEMLRDMAASLKEFFRSEDIIGRLGGDEFMIFIKNIGDEKWIDDRCEEIVRRASMLSEDGVEVGCSIGVALTVREVVHFEEMYGVADEALYLAKMMGKGRFVKKACVASAGLEAQLKMLLVDDDPLERAIFTEYFKNEYDILEAGSGEEALPLIEQYASRLSVILLDVMMPGMNGFEVLSYLRGKTRFHSIPVIVISADAENEEKALKLGANDMITKPVDPAIARLRIENVQEWKRT